MRVQCFVLLFILSGSGLEIRGQSRTEIISFDSVPVVKPKINGELYQFMDNGLKAIQYRNISNVLTKDSLTGLRNFSSAVLTELTGIGTSSGKLGFWNISGEINCNDSLPDWHVYLYCKGYQQKDRERTRDDDGSVSIQTTRTNVYFWNREATGAIIGGADTVGFFRIAIGIPDNDLVRKWQEFIFPERSFSHKKIETGPYFSYGASYGITGKFNGKNFTLIENGKSRKAWIFFDDLPAGMFQGDIDYSGVRKKSRNKPYLMINKEIPSAERRYIFRLSIISRFMNNYMDLYRY